MKYSLSLLLISCLCLSLAGCSKSATLKELLGIETVQYQESFNYDDLSAYSEGYTFTVLDLTAETVQAFQANENKATLPKIKSGWQVSHWQATPAAEASVAITEMATNYYSKNKTLEAHQQALLSVLNTPGNYYAYHSKSSGGAVYQALLYVVDAANNKIYLADCAF